MDARKYASKYIKPDSVREGPVQTRIVNVFEHEQYNRLVLELETGAQFTLSDRNSDALIRAWGDETDNWIGQMLALELGTYTDWRTKEEKETVRVRAVTPGKTAETQNGGAPASKPLPPGKVPTLKDDLSDEIPFALAFIVASAVTWLVAGGGALVA